MISDTSTLPSDPEKLKQIIAKMQGVQHQYESEIELLREQIAHLYNKLFGRKSEKDRLRTDSPQLLLFDMPEPDPDEAEPEEDAVDVPAHTRRKKGRKPLPPNLPRIDVVHDIEPEEKICGCGADLTRIGEEVSEKLDIIPAVIQIIRHIRPKYSCKQCEGVEDDGNTVKTAPVPVQLIPKAIASGGLMAHILIAKFADALPFYRQESQFDRLGVTIPRATMCSWAMKVAEACIPLRNLLREEILSGPLINADETTVQVLKEPGSPPTSKSYMWVFRGGDPRAPSLYFQYHPTRAGDVAAAFLHGYKGVVQTDGYVGYDFLDTQKNTAHIGCWAHARRKYKEAQRARGKNLKKQGSAHKALNFIRALYAIEKRAKQQKLTPEELLDVRQREAKPILDEMYVWLSQKSLQVVPKSLLGKAVNYTLRQWKRLSGYVEFADATPDNNLAENAIRPFCVGRRNWLFSGTPEGAQASAVIYSLIESAKANKVEPYKYLRFLFEKLPFADTVEDYKSLLPSNVQQSQLDETPSSSQV